MEMLVATDGLPHGNDNYNRQFTLGNTCISRNDQHKSIHSCTDHSDALNKRIFIVCSIHFRKHLLLACCSVRFSRMHFEHLAYPDLSIIVTSM
jgi:hypothetical protein